MNKYKDLTKTANLQSEILDVGLARNDLKIKLQNLVREHKTDCVIAIERVGEADDNEMYNMRGGCVSKNVTSLDMLFYKTLMGRDKSNFHTIGIGDGGNEIGMGKIQDAVRKHTPKGD
eukprot:UN24099